MLSIILSVLASVAHAALVPPSQDPFYQPTGDWQSQNPGAILAHRPVPNPLLNVTYSAAYQFLYRTTDALENPSTAVTTIIIPPNANFANLLSYQVVYDTPDVDCSPSYVIQEGGTSIVDEAFTYALAVGWVVNAPDYEGPQAAFTNGPISGQATLDSIRVALASGSITNIEPNATVALWGYSGGALASEWASELQASYAPELNISGTAIGGTTPNITNVALSVNDHGSAGLIAAGVLGITAAYPNISSVLNASFVSAADQAAFWSAKSECLLQIEASDENRDVLSYFKGGINLLSDPGLSFAVEAGGIMGLHGTPETSNRLYVYKSELDEVSPVADTDALVGKYCEAGANIKYVKDNYGTHFEEATNGGLGAFEFLISIMDGSYNMNGCLVETRNSAGSVIASSTIAATTTPPTPYSSMSVTANLTSTASSSIAQTTAPIVGSSTDSATTTASMAGPGIGASNTATTTWSSGAVTSATGSGLPAYAGSATVSQPLRVPIAMLCTVFSLLAAW